MIEFKGMKKIALMQSHYLLNKRVDENFKFIFILVVHFRIK